jgi:glutaredoxin
LIDIYIERGCWACETALRYLKTRGAPHTITSVNHDISVDELKKRFPQFISATAVLGIQLPIVVVDGMLLGGLDDLIDHLGGKYKK